MSEDSDEKSKEEVRYNKPKPERLPSPTVWPATVALGATLLAFGVVTHWLMSLVGMGVFVLGAVGWFEDLRHDQFE